jgi:hypothetical protein
MAARGDTAGMQQSAIPSVGSNFSGIAAAIKDNQPMLQGGQGAVRPPFLLKVEGSAPLERAEFLCGVFGSNGQTANSAIFVIPNLPPGTYAVTTVDVSGTAEPYMVTFVLQQMGADWKLGGFYARDSRAGAHDSQWFIDRAHEFKSKGQTRNAWLYLMEARSLAAPVSFQSTQMTDKLYDEAQAVKPSDLPADGPVNFVAGGKTYQLTQIFLQAAANEIDLVVKYQSPDISNTTQTYQDNIALIKALVQKFPEFREAFGGVVTRAVAPSGQDYGSLLTMSNIK